ncbi:MAG TPA: DUF1801 domain-containing protein [Aggregatilinea sp.]|uniref:iron chaperone n=1 Tax=Aggregatilinea sp. TaxID=2806333 RepID=UPI002CF6193B|nr:DUF1801 domain-containing protein [Aggregatilinea sp.]HML23884.1 DUF1801 domain-containing protein [Aggregatilinea sp.]
MDTDKPAPQTIDEYIAQFPDAIQERLHSIRQAVHDEAPAAQETIKYQMPTFTLNGNLIHFAAFKHHIGLYPTPTGIDAFEDDLAPYKKSKGAVQFPLDQPLPLPLIRKIVAFRVQEQAQKKKK